ncbi:YdcF family protein [Paraburkholderia sp.]|uniref:YdcF family protein n=1 Tax=Paraburkholderia sp. TaxID=1926495 RepID=UPI0023957BF3|nr:YdcF family protein [Paraburkholderia sp.]MDE1184610.1 YdcF family protein [Paraburkholderia sp.]
MILFTLLVLFFAAILLWKRARVPLAIAAALLFWLIGAGWLSAPLLHWAQDNRTNGEATHFAARTAIVVLGGGTEYDDDDHLIPKHDALTRVKVAATTYADCRKTGATCTVILSGGNPQHHEAAEADVYLPYLLERGVPRTDAIVENRSLTTYENARYVAGIVNHNGYDALIVITSAYHMPRALLDFHRFAMSPQPLISNTRHVRVGFLPRIDNWISAETALHELIGIAQFHVYRAIGRF